MTHNQVAESLGRSRTTVTNLLRLLTLTDEVKEMINSRLLEMGHARALLSLSNEQQIDIAHKIISKSLSVRDTEKLVQQIHTPKKKQEVFVTPEFEKKANEWNTLLSKRISSKTNMHFSADGKGKLVIHFDSIEEADWLMNHIRFSQVEEIE